MTEDSAQRFTSALKNLAMAVTALHREMIELRADIHEMRYYYHLHQQEQAMIERRFVGFQA